MRDLEGQADLYKYFGIKQHEITSAQQLSDITIAIRKKRQEESEQARRAQLAQQERDQVEAKRKSDEFARDEQRYLEMKKQNRISNLIAIFALFVSLISIFK